MIASLDGDESLFAEIAVLAARQYATLATRLAELAATGDLAALAAEAHKLQATWGFYATGADDSALPERLVSAARAGDLAAAVDLAFALARELELVSKEFTSWSTLRDNALAGVAQRRSQRP